MRDLDDIHEFVASRAGPRGARSFVARLNDHMTRIASTGHLGAPRDEVKPGLRLAVHGRFNIWFRVTDTEMFVLRIVRGARDTGQIDFGDEDDLPGAQDA